ncbi:hypothetical protein chiPu_0033307, partial [Chiloscyllium punctatum]|nr:hypothetical protein [Chiloscyllium punctatum]
KARQEPSWNGVGSSPLPLGEVDLRSKSGEGLRPNERAGALTRIASQSDLSLTGRGEPRPRQADSARLIALWRFKCGLFWDGGRRRSGSSWEIKPFRHCPHAQAWLAPGAPIIKLEPEISLLPAETSRP